MDSIKRIKDLMTFERFAGYDINRYGNSSINSFYNTEIPQKTNVKEKGELVIGLMTIDLKTFKITINKYNPPFYKK